MAKTTITNSNDIEDLHQQALLQNAKSYEDPKTGFTVFTEIFHLQRGKCCGNQCRHCPYGWVNVAHGARRPAKVTSGDSESVKLRLEEIQLEQNEYEQSTRTAGRQRRIKKYGGTHGGKLTNKNVPYTKKGDQGMSQLLTGERRKKSDLAFEAMGTVDELCSVVGVAHAMILERQTSQNCSASIEPQQPTAGGNNSHKTSDYGDLPEWLLQVMSRLFDAGSHIAKPVRHYKNDDEEDGDDGNNPIFQADGVGGGLDFQYVENLEDWIDLMSDQMPELRNFILPTGSTTAAQLHVCRTVCRRAERTVVPLVDAEVCDPNVLKYLNRLSDFFFVASRYANFCQGSQEIEYRRPEKRDRQRVAQARDLNGSNK